MLEQITGIILAGGKSARMGKNKATLKVGEKNVIENLVDKLNLLFHKVIIITNSPLEFSTIKKPIYRDIFPYIGPIAGIHSGLTNTEDEINFIISCDMPLVTKNSIKNLVSQKFSGDALFPQVNNNPIMLFGLYHKRVCKIAEQLIEKSSLEEVSKNNKIRLRLTDLLKYINYTTIKTSSLYLEKNELLNMNTHEDYLRIKNILQFSK